MGTCINCGRENLVTETLSFWTACIVGQRTEYVSYKRALTTTSYANFQHHSYQVCRRCTLLKRWVPIIGSILFFFILVIPMALMNKAGLPSTISAPFLLVVTSVVMIGIFAYRRAWKPTSLAMAERKTLDNKGKYTILSEKEYSALMGSQSPRA